VVEANLPRGEFIPNDVEIGGDEPAFILLTGPNMAGKSTDLRQAALITILAQMGSFVPAADADIGIADRIFCRVGAEDNLASGESTFLVEMNETAFILNTATEKSLVIMDEVGRGTGTLDGMSLAQAISEDLLKRLKCRTLFATHYRELGIANMPGVSCKCMEAVEEGGEVLFTRRLLDGIAKSSYGCHVARMAGIPEPVVERAMEIMRGMEGKKKTPIKAPKKKETPKHDDEPSLFD
jgi:DNA mismatch repair protein MutS